MLASDIRVEQRGDVTVLSGTVIRDRDRTSRPVEYRFHGGRPELVSARGDAFVAGLLVPAMRAGEDLTVEAPVSPRLLENIDALSDRLVAWGSNLQRSKVLADAMPQADQGSGVGLFFSGGVDSFHSLLKNLEEHPGGPEAITHLIFGFGLDTRYGYDQDYIDRVSRMVHEVAAETGKQAIILECNLRNEFSTGWTLYHGSVLASIALTLSPLLRRCLIASSMPIATQRPWGSHPELDPRWSTETLQIIHDSPEENRAEKITSHIAGSELALRKLRVCFEVEHQPKNCGRCRKCLHTMIALHAAGCLSTCSTFVEPLRVSRVWRVRVGGKSQQFKRLPPLLGESRFDKRLARAIRASLWRRRLREKCRHLSARR